MTINEMVQKAHKNAVTKGFCDDEVNIERCLLLIISEVVEAAEAFRKKIQAFIIETDYEEKIQAEPDKFSLIFEKDIKDTLEDELTDIVIRVGTLCGQLDIDLESHIKAKMAYNKTRPYRHGKEC